MAPLISNGNGLSPQGRRHSTSGTSDAASTGGTTTLLALQVPLGVPGSHAALFSAFAASGDRPVAIVEADDDSTVVAELTRLAVAHTPLLCVHAGVVAHGNSVIVVPGASGLGKTTLTAALVRAGFEYLSDEALAIDTGTATVQPFPRPLAMSHDSWALVASDVALPPAPGQEVLVPPAAFGTVGEPGGAVSDVLLVNRRPGPVEIEPATPGDALSELLRRSFNHFRTPGASFELLTGIARRARAWRVGYSDARELAHAVAQGL
jgi:hypothetical protein